MLVEVQNETGTWGLARFKHHLDSMLFARLQECATLQVSYHTHIPEYIPKYTWKGLVGPMWRVIRFNILMADLTLVPSKTMKVLFPYDLRLSWDHVLHAAVGASSCRCTTTP